MMMIDRLFDAVIQKRNPSVLGLDTRLEYLPQELQCQFDALAPFESAAALIRTFNYALIDATADIIPAVKLQSAYYEMYGPQGVQAFLDTARYAKEKGMLVMADCKRNDIGSTAQAYAMAYLSSTPFPDGVARSAFDMDFLTVSPYLGVDGVEPFVQACQQAGKGIFVLVKTSNPSSGQLQDIVANGKTIYAHMAELVAQWGQSQIGRHGYSSVGAVVGATYPAQGAELRAAFPSVPFLVPGYGAQGGKSDDLALTFDERGLGAVVNASRSLMCAHQKCDAPYAQATREEAVRMREDLLGALAKAKRLSY